MNPQPVPAPRSSGPTSPGPSLIKATRRAILIVSGVACLVASVVHFGLSIDVGPFALVERPILPAAIVEGAIGIALLTALGASLAGRPWAHQASVGAYLFGIVGFLIGITAVVRNAGLQTPFNVGVHAAVFPLLLVGLGIELLVTPGVARHGQGAA